MMIAFDDDRIRCRRCGRYCQFCFRSARVIYREVPLNVTWMDSHEYAINVNFGVKLNKATCVIPHTVILLCQC